MSSKTAIILAAGKGTRMKSLIPKVLHRICGREMVALVVDSACQAGYKDTVVIVPPEGEAIRKLFGDTVRYAVQHRQNGSGDALRSARSAASEVEDVAVLNGDVPLISPETLKEMARVHTARRAAVTLLTAKPQDPRGLGRIARDAEGRVMAVVEESEADEATRASSEINAGVYLFRASWLWPNLDALTPSAKGEVYLTDLVARAHEQGAVIAEVVASRSEDAMGVNDRVQLAHAEAVLQARLREKWMLAGVTMPDPASVFIEVGVVIGEDTVVQPNSYLRGTTTIGSGCEVGPGSIIVDSRVGDGCKVVSSMVEGATLEEDVRVGPFSHVRHESYLGKGVHLGNYAEVKASRLGRGTRVHHFSYLGDAEVGANVNVGAGTITCNFDGEKKNKTTIGDDVFIGSDTMLVAPVTLGPRSATGAGSVVTRDVPPDTLVVGVPAKPRPKKGPSKT
ncbi:MAG: UDP-N-acetylglucosamine diphosphorylase/glucosamine-1-phosphate N-acetyltransferase [SAR202 cluster bacterium]|nr:UDP-N-acetylglucosamine diphosphorylase/glucosamine-1-phosphate N-acetyltransferase [SAR202 cluster bacterium]